MIRWTVDLVAALAYFVLALYGWLEEVIRLVVLFCGLLVWRLLRLIWVTVDVVIERAWRSMTGER